MNITEIRKRASIIDVVSSYIEVVGHGVKRAKAICPFHDDTNPSLGFYITPAGEEHFKCHSCGEEGSAIDFVMKYEAKLGRNMSVSEAAEKVAEICGLDYTGHVKKVHVDKDFNLACDLVHYTTHTRSGIDRMNVLAQKLHLPVDDPDHDSVTKLLKAYNAGIVPDRKHEVLDKYNLKPGEVVFPTDKNGFCKNVLVGMVTKNSPVLLCDNFESVLCADATGYTGKLSAGYGAVTPVGIKKLSDYSMKRLEEIGQKRVLIACSSSKESLRRAQMLSSKGFTPLILPGAPEAHMNEFSSYLNSYMRPYEFCLMYGDPKQAIQFASSPLEKADCRRKADVLERA